MTTENTIRVSDSEYDRALREVRDDFEAKFGSELARRIQFCECNGWHEPKRIGVNWAAIGTVDAEEAMQFAAALSYASMKAASFKYNGYKLFYED